MKVTTLIFFVSVFNIFRYLIPTRLVYFLRHYFYTGSCYLTRPQFSQSYYQRQRAFRYDRLRADFCYFHYKFSHSYTVPCPTTLSAHSTCIWPYCYAASTVACLRINLSSPLCSTNYRISAVLSAYGGSCGGRRACRHSVTNGRTMLERSLHSVAHLLRSLAGTLHVRLHDAINRTEVCLIKVEQALASKIATSETAVVTFLEAPFQYIDNLVTNSAHYFVIALVTFSLLLICVILFLYFTGFSNQTMAPLSVSMALVPRSAPPA